MVGLPPTDLVSSSTTTKAITELTDLMIEAHARVSCGQR
jgi:hypothetical protein